jgi:hypothetical protein
MTTSKSSSKKKDAKPAAKRASPKAAKSVDKAQTTSTQKATATKKEASASATVSTPQPPVVDEQLQLPATHGKVNIFGGPKDRGIKPDDKLALPTGPHGVYERFRSLNPKSFYCSMRWNYHVQHLTPEEVKRSWANKKLLVTNAKTGVAVVVRAVDYGPHENTGLDIGLSPGAAQALGVEVGDEVSITLADPKSALGTIQ